MTGRVVTALAIAATLVAGAFVLRGGIGSGPIPPRITLAGQIEDMTGAKIDLATFAGKPLVINLWATWCGPCRLETPQLVGLHRKYKDRGITFIGISVDDLPDAIRAFASDFKVGYPMLVGVGHEEFIESIGYQGALPFSVLVKADGSVAVQITGLETTADWEKHLEALLH